MHGLTSLNTTPDPVLPDYAAGGVRALVPALLTPGERPPWLGRASGPVVLLVVDGLGWEQFDSHRALMPTLAGFTGGPIVTVAPSTTAAALTSITTGLTPGEHGLIGYRMMLGGDVVNTLRWTSSRGDARPAHPPTDIQPFTPFLGEDVVVCTRSGFDGSGFTVAHLRGTRQRGWSEPSNLAVRVAAAVRAGERFVYAYYDGVDHVAHEFGFGAFYDAEVRMADVVIQRLAEAVPPGTTIVVTADHGQVHVGERTLPLDPAVRPLVRVMSGEGRFRWLHAKPGAAQDLLEAAAVAYSPVAWVRSRQQIIDDGWFGPVVSPPVAARLGDVALVAHEPVSFDDPAERTAVELIGRHGSLTSAEMLVPRLVLTT